VEVNWTVQFVVKFQWNSQLNVVLHVHIMADLNNIELNSKLQ
jgi:hypothetical protein